MGDKDDAGACRWLKLSFDCLKEVQQWRGTLKGTRGINTDCAYSVQGEALLIFEEILRCWLAEHDACCVLPHPPLTLCSLPIGALILASTSRSHRRSCLYQTAHMMEPNPEPLWAP